jgi:hypothetical protein
MGLSMFEFLRETRKHARITPGMAGLLSAGPASLPSMQRKDDWEESPKKKASEE